MLVALMSFFFFFCKQKTAYEMRISDWSSDVCSSDLACSASIAPNDQRYASGRYPPVSAGGHRSMAAPSRYCPENAPKKASMLSAVDARPASEIGKWRFSSEIGRAHV